MADNYLGRKMEEYEAQKCASVRTRRVSLVSLLAKNRSTRGFDASFKVRHDQLLSLIEAARLSPSAMNQQVLRYRLVTDEEAHLLLPHRRVGGAVPNLGLPLPGTEPNAFIVICSTVEESKYVDMDLGIVAQSMLLQAVEIGLGGICIGAFDHKELREELQLPYEPLLVLAIGRPKEHIELKECSEGDVLTYYREGDVHYVPKIKVDDLIIK